MRKILSLSLAVLLIAACSEKEIGQDIAAPSDATKAEAGETVTIKVTLPEIEGIITRGGLSLNESGGMDPVWAPDDAILVGGEVFTLQSSEGKVGIFEGKAPQGTTFDISYPAQAMISIGAPRQAANGTISHLRYSASLKGVDSYEDVCFGYGWAAAHGGSFSQSGFLRLVLNMPERATDIVSVSFSGEDLPTLDLNVLDGALSDHSFTAFIPSPELQLDAAKEVCIEVNTSNGDIFTNRFYPGTQTLYEGHLITLVTSPSRWVRSLSGEGSEGNPYLISCVEDLNNVRDLISENTFTYFLQISDIDFDGVSDWVPINLENKSKGIMYNGDGHKISNLKCKSQTWASIFGVLHGEVKNLIVEDSEIITTTTSPVGTIAAWCGNVDGTLQASLSNVHVVRGKVSCSTHSIIGGLCSRARASSFKDCSFDGVVERTGAESYVSDYYPVGGMLGQALEGMTIEGCHTSGSLTTASGRACGGILGQCSVTLNITDCGSTMTISARDDVAGGIVGYYGNGTISGCTVESNIKVSANGSGTSYIGGIAAHTSGSVTLTNCSFKGNLEAYSGLVGGILGQCNTSSGSGALVSQCYAEGTIKGKNLLGGIVGRSTDTGLKINDCGAAVDITATQAYVGGVLGDAPKNTVVSRCYATGFVKGSYGIGGIVGRAFGRQGSSDNLDTDVHTTVEDCIAFNSEIRTVTSGGENPASHYSGGAIVGCTSRPNTLKNCWRSSNLPFNFYSDASLNVLFDHPDSSPDAPLTQASGSAKWYSPYHGKAAAEGATISSVASQIGWSETVWDLSGDVPVLK